MSVSDELQKLANLRSTGALSESEFQVAKEKILGGGGFAAPGGGFPATQGQVENKRVLAGVLALLLGSIGAHRFVLGDTSGGLIRLALSCLGGIGAIIGIVEGIIYLTKTDEEFYQIYQVQKKAWF